MLPSIPFSNRECKVTTIFLICKLFVMFLALRTKNSLGNKHTAEGTIGPVMRGVEGFDDRNRG